MPATPRPGEAGSDARGGVLVLDKPPGPTSHDCVAAVRRKFRGSKVGHTGTLDPFATGVLPIVVGRATRLARYLSGTEKEYDALIRLGRATDTHDATGTVVFEAPDGLAIPDSDAVATVLDGYRGTWMQTPPAFSAKLAGGVRAYEQARRGRPVELAPVAVTVSALELLSVAGPLVRLRLVSSAGFYVRSLAHDIGVKLGTGATLEGLRRLRSGLIRPGRCRHPGRPPGPVGPRGPPAAPRGPPDRVAGHRPHARRRRVGLPRPGRGSRPVRRGFPGGSGRPSAALPGAWTGTWSPLGRPEPAAFCIRRSY